MNLRNTMINDLIRIKHGELTKKEFKQIKNKKYNNKKEKSITTNRIKQYIAPVHCKGKAPLGVIAFTIWHY